MSVSKDKVTGKWMVQCRITTQNGKCTHRKKRGFPTKKEAKAWEANLKAKVTQSTEMLFSDFIELYLEDMSHRVRYSTLRGKRYTIDLKLIPTFGKMKLEEITPKDIRSWQNVLTSFQNEKGEAYSPTYLKHINNQLTAIFNYAVKYYGLKENPCHKAGGMGRKNASEMLFWVKEEFEQFISCLEEQPLLYTAFMTLYYTGMRIGELTALTREDVDLERLTIRINKSYQRMDGMDIISEPKTPKSNRTITIPSKLGECLSEYFNLHYKLGVDHRIFPITKSRMNKELKKNCMVSGVKIIRVHDIRHSHASLLVELGFTPLLIAERLGHEKVETTLNIYSHLYPNKQVEVANRLDSCWGSTEL